MAFCRLHIIKETVREREMRVLFFTTSPQIRLDLEREARDQIRLRPSLLSSPLSLSPAQEQLGEERREKREERREKRSNRREKKKILVNGAGPFAASSCNFNYTYTYTYTYCSIGFAPRVRSWIRAAAEGGGDGTDRPRSGRLAADGPRVVEVAAPVVSGGGGAGFGARDAELAMWEKLGAVVRLSYGIGIYAAMALTGRFICQMAGIDCTGGFHPSLTAVVEGLGYAAPPIMALLFILDDEVVKYSPHARAIRDVEDEELRSFFYGMSPWQFILLVTASSIGEELFYRVAVQGALADIFLRGTELMKDARGIASLSGMVPPFVPFAQTFAAAITAALTGSLYYIATAPKDPTYVVTPAMRSHTGRENLKKLFAAWYERRQMRKIYSPLLEGILAFYLGFEWIQTDNILAPMYDHPRHILCRCPWPWAVENPRPQKKVATKDSGN